MLTHPVAEDMGFRKQHVPGNGAGLFAAGKIIFRPVAGKKQHAAVNRGNRAHALQLGPDLLMGKRALLAHAQGCGAMINAE